MLAIFYIVSDKNLCVFATGEVLLHIRA